MRVRFGAILTMFVFGGALAVFDGCGGSPAAPSSASSAGAWLGYSTLTTASGGECVGGTLQAALGARDVFMAAIKQVGGSLDATITSQGNGISCAYAGTAGTGSLSLNLTVCQARRVPGVQCGGGAVRDLELVNGTLTANVNTAVGTGSGIETSTWSVMAPGTTAPLGTLSLTATFTWVFLGLPPSDYHEFTGHVFPGYEDGTISIPADPNPFCSRCGWFFR
jgi:hypothetical protein